MKFNYIDLFAGCGGLSLGLHNSGWTGLFAIEKNEDAFATFNFNLLSHKGYFDWPGWLPKENLDINDVIKNYKENLEELKGKIPLVVGGPPCQGFSMAGSRKPDDLRNKLSKKYLKFIRIVKPKVVLFENVHGFTVGFKNDKKKGKPYSQIIIDSLKRMGYKVHNEIIDVSEFGVPQKRKRFILIGCLDKDPKLFFDILHKNKNRFLQKYNLKTPVNVKDAIGDLLQSNGQVICPDIKRFKSGIYGLAQTPYQSLCRKEISKNTIIPDSHRFANQKDATIDLYKKIMQISNDSKRITPKQNIVEGLRKRSVVPLKSDSVCNTVTSIPDDYIHYCEPRILTVREMARFQSFPDWFEFKGKYTTGGSRRKFEVPRYTQVANAVPPFFAQQVGLALREVLSDE